MSQDNNQATPNSYVGTGSQSAVEREHLCVDEFIKDMVGSRALATAFELGLIDFLIQHSPCSTDGIRGTWPSDYRGLGLLLDLLTGSGVLERQGETILLTRRFTNALRFRDLLEAKLQFSFQVSADVADLFTELIRDPSAFQQRARMFQLFRYDSSPQVTPENLEQARRWMRITTALTRYEAAACIGGHDFARCRRVLDIGGNSGEFALQLCRKYPHIQATVLDLPVVCEVGRQHIHGQPGAERVCFLAGDARTDDLPGGFDAVVFKSMLHDWPDDQARLLLRRASECLAPDGVLVIFERGPLELAAQPLPYSMLPLLLLFRSFRSPTFYVDVLKGLEFERVMVDRIDLETPFFLVAASR